MHTSLSTWSTNMCCCNQIASRSGFRFGLFFFSNFLSQNTRAAIDVPLWTFWSQELTADCIFFFCRRRRTSRRETADIRWGRRTTFGYQQDVLQLRLRVFVGRAAAWRSRDGRPRLPSATLHARRRCPKPSSSSSQSPPQVDRREAWRSEKTSVVRRSAWSVSFGSRHVQVAAARVTLQTFNLYFLFSIPFCAFLHESFTTVL